MPTKPILAVFLTIALGLCPAASGQPRADTLKPLEGPVPPTGDTPAATGWRSVEVVAGLEHPWAIAWLPDGSALITERPGRLRLLRPDGTLHPDPIVGVPEVLALRQGGLLDVVLHPDFEDNRFVYISYSHGDNRANHTRIARGRLDGHELKDFEVLFTTQPAKPRGFHFGCRMVFLPDNSLVFTMGEGGLKDPSQDMGSHLGKVLRIMDDGSPATDNPFQARVDAAQEIYSYGHRNPQGLAVHPDTGEIYATEHGPRGGDELNLIEPGNNYGWPVVTYGYEYHGPRVSQETSRPGMVDPLINWIPSIAASGLAFYTGDKIPGWKGDLFAGGLILRQVRRVIFEDGEILGEETLQFDKRIRDVRDGPDGYLYVLTDERNGQLLRIEPSDE